MTGLAETYVEQAVKGLAMKVVLVDVKDPVIKIVLHNVATGAVVDVQECA